MIAFQNCNEEFEDTWQDGFVEILPEIRQHLSRAFRRLDPCAEEDAVADGVIHCLLAYRGLHARGRLAAVRPANLAWFARLQVRNGREPACRRNGWEPLARYAQCRHGFRPEPQVADDDEAGTWIQAIVVDRRASVPDQVAARLDIATWLAELPTRMASIAKDLAYGHSTRETAAKYRLSAGRISQLRRMLEQSWKAFQGEDVAAANL